MKKQNPPKKISGFIKTILLLFIALFIFSIGVGVGVYRWPPFSLLRDIRNYVLHGQATPTPTPEVSDFLGDDELLRYMFSDPLINGDQIYEPIRTLDDVNRLNKSLLFPFEDFFNAYENLKITNDSIIELDNGSTKVLEIKYELSDLEFAAYAYIVNGIQTSSRAALIIPGSGINQSSAIYKNESSNYHFGILEALGDSSDKFVYIKPNEDCLAFNNGKGKLNRLSFINWMINSGGSYSANYIVSSLAITKYLHIKYNQVSVAGLSQGGIAALYNALQSQPNIAIIASGYSVIRDKIDYSNHGQITIPGLQKFYNLDTLKKRINQSTNTHFLFTYGTADDDGLYKIDAIEKLTCNYLADLSNVDCEIHNGGHIFPKEIIQDFLNSNP